MSGTQKKKVTNALTSPGSDWFWRRLEQASADFDELPRWMKRKDAPAFKSPATPRHKKTTSRRRAA